MASLRHLAGRAVRRLRPTPAPRTAAASRERAKKPSERSARDPSPREQLTRALERGRPLEGAVLAQVRALVSAGDADAALSLAESLRHNDETRDLGRVAAGIVAYRRGFAALAWSHLDSLPRNLWAHRAAAEYVRSGLAVAPGRALEEVRELVRADPPGVPVKSWHDIVIALFGYGDSALAREVFAIFDRRADADGPGSWRQAARLRDWLRPWVAADPDSPTAPTPPGNRPGLAIMDYGHPGANRASANIGDHIQSLALLGHVVRHDGVRLHGEPELVALLEDLRRGIRPDHRRHDVDADLEVLTVHRDASMYEPVPEGTWVLCFGWYMHALFGMRHGFPLHDNLRPIFVSFHCNKRDLLTESAVEYLRRYGPVGCRDWSTVYLLRSLDVPAFFSGCVTTTTGTLFAPLAEPPAPDAPIGYVDADPASVPPGAPSYRHSFAEVRTRSFVANVRDAYERLDTYRQRHRRMVTSRLHCYLPARAIGVDVDFRPSKRSDVRFDGLIDLDDAAFDDMRHGLSDKLEQVLGAIFAGRPEGEVYALWRELTAADVAAAEQRRRLPHALPAVPEALGAQVRSAIARTSVHGSAGDPPSGAPVHCAVVLGPGQGRALSALISSLRAGTSRPLHVWVLGLAGTQRGRPRLIEAHPDVRLAFVPSGRLSPTVHWPGGRETEPGELVPLVLADLLPEVERVALLRLPAIVEADVAELAELDLGGHLLAAPRETAADAVSGFALLNRAAGRLDDRVQAAAGLRRTAHFLHRFDFDAFADHVLVMDLARMRTEGFASRAVPLIAEFGLGASEALHYLLGPDRADVPERWATVPTRTSVPDPALLHWADRVKPWQPELTPERERWRRHAPDWAA